MYWITGVTKCNFAWHLIWFLLDIHVLHLHVSDLLSIDVSSYQFDIFVTYFLALECLNQKIMFHSVKGFHKIYETDMCLVWCWSYSQEWFSAMPCFLQSHFGSKSILQCIELFKENCADLVVNNFWQNFHCMWSKVWDLIRYNKSYDSKLCY